jgi:hypothetical protein
MSGCTENASTLLIKRMSSLLDVTIMEVYPPSMTAINFEPCLISKC